MITSITRAGEQREIICLTVSPGDTVLTFTRDLAGGNICGCWYPGSGFDRSVKPEWEKGFETMTTVLAPVICCLNEQEESCILAACSEVQETVRMSCGIVEETGEFRLSVEIPLDFMEDEENRKPDTGAKQQMNTGENRKPDTEENGQYRQKNEKPYEVFLYLSTKRERYEEALKGAVDWWDTLLKQPSLPVPEGARKPAYSTWYSYHQQMTGAEILEECKKAAELGMGTVIVDDGWQTGDNGRGYAYCGDWQIFEGKFPDFPGHVRQVRRLGMKYMIWFAVPFVGIKSVHWEEMKDKLLTFIDHMQAGVLDPRYPEVREYVALSSERLVKEYGLDGLKLDFVDEFYLRSGEEKKRIYDGNERSGMITSVQEAAVCLMQDITNRLRAIKPDILIEFRQKYVGPVMRRLGNLFRVDDCPGSFLTNRVGIADLRLLSKDTAVHSDMILWQEEAKPEDIAMHLISSMFGTMQISVCLKRLSEEQEKTLAFWLDFANKHRSLLQEGQFTAHDPLHLYPILESRQKGRWVMGVYEKDKGITISGREEGYILYGAGKGRLFLEVEEDCDITSYNCMGEMTRQWKLEKGVLVKCLSPGTLLHVYCGEKG